MSSDALLFGPPTHDSLQGNAAAVQVAISTNPMLPAKISIDGKVCTAPTNLVLGVGPHQFSAISNVPDPNAAWVSYTFQCWLLNGKCVSKNATTIININTVNCTIIAQYSLGESGWGAPAKPNSLPNPKGPMTPNLILENPGPKEV